MNHSGPQASIVILNFLKSRRVCENVESIQRQQVDFPYEVIVVDNSCNAEHAAKLEALRKYDNLRVKINSKNLGYIRGNNLGASMASGKYLLIVNPDIIWKDSQTLQKLVDYMDENPQIGILGPKQINDNDNSVAMTVRAFPKLFLQVARRTFLRKLPVIRKWVAYDEMRHLDYSMTQPVDWLQSSFWVIRRELWDRLGGLDKAYYLFMSDPDLCFKCWEAGYQVIYYPEVTVLADGRRLSAGGFLDFFRTWLIRQHLKDAVIYQFKHMFRKPVRPKEARRGRAG